MKNRVVAVLGFFLLLTSCKSESEERKNSRVRTFLDYIEISQTLLSKSSIEARRQYVFSSLEDSTYSIDKLWEAVAGFEQNTQEFNQSLQIGAQTIVEEMNRSSVLVHQVKSWEKKMGPRDFVCYIMALYYQDQKKSDTAVSLFSEAIALNPHVETYYERKAFLLVNMDKLGDAIAELNKVIAFTDTPWDYQYKAYLLGRLKNKKGLAINFMDDAIHSLSLHLEKMEQKQDSQEPLDELDKATLERELEDWKKEKHDFVTEINSASVR